MDLHDIKKQEDRRTNHSQPIARRMNDSAFGEVRRYSVDSVHEYRDDNMLDNRVDNSSGLPASDARGLPTGDARDLPGGVHRQTSRVAFVIALFLLIYIPLTFNWFRGKSTPTDILRNGSLYEALRAEALVVRNEELLFSSSDGVSVTAVNEGERVQGRSAVATIYDQMSYELMDELKSVNRLILEEQYQNLEHSNVFLQEANSIDKDISLIIRKMIPEINLNSLVDASERTKTINRLVLKKAEAFGSLETDDPYINSLKEEKRRIEREVAKNSFDIYCESPGHLSFNLDGNETELTPKSVLSLDPERFDEIAGAAGQKGQDMYPNSYSGLPVRAGEPFAKIVRDNVFYLAIKLPGEYIGRFSAGDKVRVRTEMPYREFDGATVVSATVFERGEDGGYGAKSGVDDGKHMAESGEGDDKRGANSGEGDGERSAEDDREDGERGAEDDREGGERGAEDDGDVGGYVAEDGAEYIERDTPDGILVLRLTKYLFDFLNVRVVSVELVEKYKEGLKIPLKCLRDINAGTGEAYITLLKGSHASIRKVRILASNDYYAIIESFDNSNPEGRINRYDTYVRDAVNIEDGMQLIK